MGFLKKGAIALFILFLFGISEVANAQWGGWFYQPQCQSGNCCYTMCPSGNCGVQTTCSGGQCQFGRRVVDGIENVVDVSESVVHRTVQNIAERVTQPRYCTNGQCYSGRCYGGQCQVVRGGTTSPEPCEGVQEEDVVEAVPAPCAPCSQSYYCSGGGCCYDYNYRPRIFGGFFGRVFGY